MTSSWQCGRYRISFDRPRVMGVLNVTPDSFSDGGRFWTLEAALERASLMIEEGADILDIGGESTRPGAPDVPAEVELQRVIPVLRALRDIRVPISVDTSKPEVMRAALEAGASIINDVRALQLPGAIDEVRDSGCGIILMHMQGQPRTMQTQPHYGDVVEEVAAWLEDRRDILTNAGIDLPRIVLDPGFGFGKTHAHNLRLLRGLGRFVQTGSPTLAGLSRKSTLGEITGKDVGQRLGASIAASIAAVEWGAQIVRVHDVAPTRDALAVWSAVRSTRSIDEIKKEWN